MLKVIDTRFDTRTEIDTAKYGKFYEPEILTRDVSKLLSVPIKGTTFILENGLHLKFHKNAERPTKELQNRTLYVLPDEHILSNIFAAVHERSSTDALENTISAIEEKRLVILKKLKSMARGKEEEATRKQFLQSLLQLTDSLHHAVRLLHKKLYEQVTSHMLYDDVPKDPLMQMQLELQNMKERNSLLSELFKSQQIELKTANAMLASQTDELFFQKQNNEQLAVELKKAMSEVARLRSQQSFLPGDSRRIQELTGSKIEQQKQLSEAQTTLFVVREQCDKVIEKLENDNRALRIVNEGRTKETQDLQVLLASRNDEIVALQNTLAKMERKTKKEYEKMQTYFLNINTFLKEEIEKSFPDVQVQDDIQSNLVVLISEALEMRAVLSSIQRTVDAFDSENVSLVERIRTCFQQMRTVKDFVGDQSLSDYFSASSYAMEELQGVNDVLYEAFSAFQQTQNLSLPLAEQVQQIIAIAFNTGVQRGNQECQSASIGGISSYRKILKDQKKNRSSV